MFAGTEKRKFHCARCRRKEEKRRYYWGELLGIPVTEWPARDQYGNIIKNEDDILPESNDDVPVPTIIRKKRRSLGLFAEDVEFRDLQENIKELSGKLKKRKKKKRKKRRARRTTSKEGKPGRRTGFKRFEAGEISGYLTDEETRTNGSSSGSEWYSSEEKRAEENLRWWETKHNCQRCLDHHTAHKKWRPKTPKSPNSEKMRMHANMIIMKRLLKKEEALMNDLEARPAHGNVHESLTKWWTGTETTCQKCRKHHDASGDESSTSSTSEAKTHMEGTETDIKLEGVDTLPGNIANPSSIKETQIQSHVLSPSERFANKWKEKHLSLRWWEPETKCKKCADHHMDAATKFRLLLQTEKVDSLLEKTDNILSNLDNIYLPRESRSVACSLPILENDAKIKGTLKPIKTTRQMNVKLTLPCELHSRHIFDESKDRAKARACSNKDDGREGSTWWEVNKNCERCSYRYQTHQQLRSQNGSPKEVVKSRSRTREMKRDCERCAHHHEASGQLLRKERASLKQVKQDRTKRKESLRHVRLRRGSGETRENILPTKSRTEMHSTDLPLDLKVVREVKQDGVTLTSTDWKSRCRTTLSDELESKFVNLGKSNMPIKNCEGILRTVEERRNEMLTAQDDRIFHSKSCPNLSREIGVQTALVHDTAQPSKALTPSKSFLPTEQGRNPWGELQAPQPVDELRKLHAREKQEKSKKLSREKKEKRLERIRRFSQEAYEKQFREALNRAPRVAPVGYRWRDGLKKTDADISEEESRSPSPRSTVRKQLHANEFNILGSGRDRPLTPPSPFARDESSPHGSPKRHHLRRKTDMKLKTGTKSDFTSYNIKSNSPSEHLERKMCTSDHRLKPKRNRTKVPHALKTINDANNDNIKLSRAEEVHAPIRIKEDCPIPKVEVPVPAPPPRDPPEVVTMVHVDENPLLLMKDTHPSAAGSDNCCNWTLMTEYIKCLPNHKDCGKMKKHHVVIPKLDLRKVKEGQQLELGNDLNVETADTYMDCFGRKQRKDHRRCWIDLERGISSSSGTLSTSTLESGYSREEDLEGKLANDAREARRQRALANLDLTSSTSGRNVQQVREDNSKELLEKARQVLESQMGSRSN